MFADYRIQLRRLEQPVGDEFARWLDPEEPQVDLLLMGLLWAAVVRTGGALTEASVAEYDLLIRDGYGRKRVFGPHIDMVVR